MKRRAFTLIELITVMAIILVLMGMIAAVVYSQNSKQVVANGSTALVGWFKTAQAYALRDQKPYGVRFSIASSQQITTAQYIEQPADWVGPTGATLTAVPTGGQSFSVTASAGDFTGGFSATAQYPIQSGDYLEVGNQIAFISGVAGPKQLNCSWMAGDNVGMWTFSGRSDWRIVRQPTTMLGSDILALPNGVCIDTATSCFAPPAAQYKSVLPVNGTTIDVLFAPSGSVITPGVTQDVRFWLRDSTLPTGNTFAGEQFIVSVGTRTGLISVQPVDVRMDSTNTFYKSPYTFLQDGRSSGF